MSTHATVLCISKAIKFESVFPKCVVYTKRVLSGNLYTQSGRRTSLRGCYLLTKINPLPKVASTLSISYISFSFLGRGESRRPLTKLSLWSYDSEKWCNLAIRSGLSQASSLSLSLSLSLSRSYITPQLFLAFRAKDRR